MRSLALLAFVLFSALAGTVSAQPANVSYTKLGSFPVSNPAFMMVAPFQWSLPTPTLSLFISSFTGNPFGSAAVYLVENITSYYGNWGNIQPVNIGLSLQWPNKISPLPAEAQEQLELTNAFLVPDGFLVPGKDNGGLYIVSQTPVPPSVAEIEALPGNTQRLRDTSPVSYEITDTTEDKGYFYHTAIWVDVNDDGLLDVISAHANKPLFGSTKTGLVWLEQPPTGVRALPWQETLITEGPDVFFATAELDDNPATLELFATEFFSSRLTLNIIAISRINGGELLFRKILDSTIGPAYNVVILPLNNNNTLNLLVTNHQADASASGVFSYTIPDDFKNGVYERVTVASNFTVTEGGFNQAAPGFAYAVNPFMNTPLPKPYVLVAGDGSQSAYLMTPGSADNSYSIETVVQTKGTVGSLFITDDWNGDGLREFLVPDYDENTVLVYSFANGQQ